MTLASCIGARVHLHTDVICAEGELRHDGDELLIGEHRVPIAGLREHRVPMEPGDRPIFPPDLALLDGERLVQIWRERPHGGFCSALRG